MAFIMNLLVVCIQRQSSQGGGGGSAESVVPFESLVLYSTARIMDA